MTDRIIISSIVLLSLMLAACGGAKEAPVTVPAGAQAGDLVGLEPCTYKAGDVEYAADCGTLVVPENRADPNSRLIALTSRWTLMWDLGGRGWPSSC